jgi:hypothetical protein
LFGGRKKGVEKLGAGALDKADLYQGRKTLTFGDIDSVAGGGD